MVVILAVKTSEATSPAVQPGRLDFPGKPGLHPYPGDLRVLARGPTRGWGAGRPRHPQEFLGGGGGGGGRTRRSGAVGDLGARRSFSGASGGTRQSVATPRARGNVRART